MFIGSRRKIKLMFAKQNKRDIEGGVVTWLRFATNEIACESRVARRDEYANSETVCPTTTTDNNDCKAHSSVDADKRGLLHRSRRNADRTHFQGEGLQRRAKKVTGFTLMHTLYTHTL